ncbi:CPBP family intramembrane glutamic endopeptidase [Asaia sp. VD9]|uniref:CPBP family intramembrane glutamic endopeptidase n=1 Tax=Asaia sp. VD9 TaxID=3081235 RepID=UPI0030164B72
MTHHGIPPETGPARSRWGTMRLGAEFMLLFGGTPLLILSLRRAMVLFIFLWVAALLATWWMRGTRARPHHRKREIAVVFGRFLVLGSGLALLCWQLAPEHFLDLPRHRPGFWLLLMLLYPLLSVWPQEVLYRQFLFTRYAALLETPLRRITASAIAFGFAHVIFLNWIAVALTVAGGVLFARDYERHRSLRLSCLEHSLFGCLIFTLGLGHYFYTGAAWHHE